MVCRARVCSTPRPARLPPRITMVVGRGVDVVVGAGAVLSANADCGSVDAIFGVGIVVVKLGGMAR